MTISQGFDDYCAKVIPPAAGAVQVTECRRAFFAGAAHALMTMLHATNALPEAEAVRVLEVMIAEYSAFAERGGVA